ncbi:hypothetical protein KM043_012738 [Ampulex compressa]|nr:hypothetical protein KM043_012738 [Ampulex compressa]
MADGESTMAEDPPEAARSNPESSSSIRDPNTAELGSKGSIAQRGSSREVAHHMDSSLGPLRGSNQSSTIKASSSVKSNSANLDTRMTTKVQSNTSHDPSSIKTEPVSPDAIKKPPTTMAPSSIVKNPSLPSRNPRSCQRRLVEIIGKHELRNEELGKQEDDLRQRLDLLECSMPAVMVSNIWRMSQDTPACGIRRALEKQLKTPAVCCPSSPSRHYDCRVREAEAERKEAQRRAEEARDLWQEKRDVLEERTRKLEEARRIQEERKLRIERLTKEAKELREALEATSHEGFCEAGECGDAECKRRWLSRVSSTGSVRSTDVECLEKLQELAEAELSMKRQIAELERREEAYMRTLQQADELWSGVEGEAASARSSLQEELETKRAANQRMAERICGLEDELERLRSRMAACRTELEKYMSTDRLEAAIGRDDDLAAVKDKAVHARVRTAHRISGREDDQARVADKGALMKQDIADKETLMRLEVLDKEAAIGQELVDEETLMRQEVLDEETMARADLVEAAATAAFVGDDKVVSVRPEIAELGVDRQVDLIGLKEAGIGIRPEDLTEQRMKVEEARKYLAQLGSLDELYYDDDYGVCDPDFACNDQVFGPKGMDDEELAVLEAKPEERGPISDPAQEGTLEMKSSPMKPDEATEETSDAGIIKQQPIEVLDAADEAETAAGIEGSLAIEKDDREIEASIQEPTIEDIEVDRKKDDLGEEMKREAPRIAEEMDVPVLQSSPEIEISIKDQPDKEIPEDQSVIADEFTDEDKITEDMTVEEPTEVSATVTKFPEESKVEKDTFEVPRNELVSWLDAINTIRATIAAKIEDLVPDIKPTKVPPQIEEKDATEERAEARISSVEKLPRLKLEAEITERPEDALETKSKVAPEVKDADEVASAGESPAAMTKAQLEFAEAPEQPTDSEPAPEAEAEFEGSRIEDVPTVESAARQILPATQKPATIAKDEDEPPAVAKKERPEVTAQETIDALPEYHPEPPEILVKTEAPEEEEEEAEAPSRSEEEKHEDKALQWRRAEEAETREEAELLAEGDTSSGAGTKVEEEVKVEEMAGAFESGERLETGESREVRSEASPILGEAVVKEEMEEVVAPEEVGAPPGERGERADAARETEAEASESLDVARPEMEKVEIKVKTEGPREEVGLEGIEIGEEVISIETKSEEMEAKEEMVSRKIEEVEMKLAGRAEVEGEEREMALPEMEMMKIEREVLSEAVPKIEEEILSIEQEPLISLKEEELFEEIAEKGITAPVTPIDGELVSEPSIDSAIIEAEEKRKPTARPRILPCVCKPRVCPLQPPAKSPGKIEITQTETIRTETIEILTQTITSVSTQTYPAQRIVKRYDPLSFKTVSRSTDPEAPGAKKKPFRKKHTLDESTITTSASSSQTDRSSSPLGTSGKSARKPHPLSALLETLALEQASRSEPERELRTISYGRRSTEADKLQCNCCSCGKDTSPAPKARHALKSPLIPQGALRKIAGQRSPKKSDQETWLRGLCLECRTRREQRAARSPALPKPTRAGRKIMCDQEVCACPNEAPKPGISQPWRKSGLARKDESCTAKIPRAKSSGSREREVRRGERGGIEGEESERREGESVGRDSLANCICFKVVDNDGVGQRRILSCSCGESD